MSKKTPLLDLLRSVPKDATQAYQHYDGSSRNIPYGILCSNAAKRIEELEKLCCDLESELTSVWSDLEFKNEDARSLLDGCYEIVELFTPETPSQVEWKQKWLEGARKHGASET